jgi:hypothetical protein
MKEEKRGFLVSARSERVCLGDPGSCFYDNLPDIPEV